MNHLVTDIEARLPPRPRHYGRTIATLLVVAAITALTLQSDIGGITLDFGAIIDNWDNGSRTISKFMRPDWSFVPRTVTPMLETMQMAVVGAAAAALVSIPITLWAAKPTDPNTWGRGLVRTLINVTRAVPDLVYATVLVAMVGVGVLPGLLTLFLFDLGVVVKLVSEAIDSAEHDYLEAGASAGGTQTQINYRMALPQSWPLFANQWLYALELNVRISAILGLVGAGGIGRLIEERRGFYAYDDVSVIIVEILVVVIAIELFSNFLRRRLR